MLKLNTVKHDWATIVEIEGDVDFYSSPEVRKAIIELTQAQTPVILINLRKVGYMDSSGVATLVEGLQKVGKYGGKFKLTNLRNEVKGVFELSRLDKVFEIYNTIEEAQESLE